MKKENIILLHGALGTKAQFVSLGNILSKHFDVHLLNFEGHGDVPSNKEFSIDLFAENVIDMLQVKNISKTHIFGYSMGGYVALRLAMKSPELVDRVVTLGTKFNWNKKIAAQEIKMLNPEKIEEKVPAFAKRLYELHSSNDWKVVMRKTAQLMANLGDGDGMSDEELKRIDHNVLIAIGELDNMVSFEESERAAELLQNGQLKKLIEVKHPIEKVDASQLATVIVDFILKK